MNDWQKSTASGEANECVEIRAADGLVEIRESERAEIIVRTTPRKWAAFVRGVKAGEFDRYGDFTGGLATDRTAP